MKKKLPFVILLLFLTGCTQGNSRNTNEISFQKKKECSDLIKQVEERIPKNQGSRFVNFHKIFYSPKKDTCLYAYNTNEYYEPWDKDALEIIWTYYIVDAFTHEKLFIESGDEAYIKYDRELKQYE